MQFKSSDIGKWISWLRDERYIISQIIPITQDVVRIKFRTKHEYVRENNNSNTVVAVTYSIYIFSFKIFLFRLLLQR